MAHEGLGDDERQKQFDEIVETLEEHGGEMPYDELNEILSHSFEGVRLVLKSAKEAGLVDYDGVVPSFNGTITLTSESE